MNKKIIYYYQTFSGLQNLINDSNLVVTHIHLSSIHFGKDENNQKYIHLNFLKKSMKLIEISERAFGNMITQK